MLEASEKYLGLETFINRNGAEVFQIKCKRHIKTLPDI